MEAKTHISTLFPENLFVNAKEKEKFCIFSAVDLENFVEMSAE